MRPSRPRQNQQSPRRSRFPPGVPVPDRHRAATAPARARPRPATSAPTPLGPPTLCADSVNRSAFRLSMPNGRFPNAWIASTCSTPPAACTSAAASVTGCNAPVSLLASITDTSAGGPPSSIARRRARSSTPARVTPMVPIASGANRPPASTEACSMAETSNRLAGSPGASPKPRRQRQRIRLGSARCKHDISRQRADSAGDRGPRVLDEFARLAALGMYRGRIAGEIPRRRHRLPGLAAKRRGRVPVEIDPVRHGDTILPIGRYPHLKAGVVGARGRYGTW